MSVNEDTTVVNSLHGRRQDLWEAACAKQLADLDARLSELRGLDKRIAERLFESEANLSLTIRLLQDMLRRTGGG